MLSYRDNISHLVLTIHQLLEQKSLLAKMLTRSERRCRDNERTWQGVITKQVQRATKLNVKYELPT